MVRLKNLLFSIPFVSIFMISRPSKRLNLLKSKKKIKFSPDDDVRGKAHHLGGMCLIDDE